MARDRGLGNQRLRPVRPLADAPGLRQVLRLHRRRDQPVGAVPLRRRHAGRAAGRSELPLHDRHDGQGGGLDQVPEGADARQAVLRLLRARRHARAAPRAQGVDRQAGRASSTRAGTSCARRRWPGRSRWASCPRARSWRRSRRRSRTGTSSRPTRSACSRARPRCLPRIVEYTDHEIGRMLKAFDDVGRGRQHARLLHRRRQRHQRRRRPERHVQRVHLLQRRAGEGAGHAEAASTSGAAPRPTRTWRRAGRWRSTRRSAG